MENCWLIPPEISEDNSGSWLRKPLSAFPIPTALLYGLGVCTTFLTDAAKGHIEKHLLRLEHDSSYLGITTPGSLHSLERPLREFGLIGQREKVVLRISVLPNIGELFDYFSKNKVEISPILITLRPLRGLSRPVKLQTTLYEHPYPTIKHTNMGIGLSLKRACKLEGVADDVLWVNRSGRITESTHANFFGIKAGTLITADPEQDGCLPGIVRQEILENSQALSIPVHCKAMEVGQLSGLEGAFLTNSVIGAVPISKIDNVELPWPESAHSLFKAVAGRHLGTFVLKSQ